MRINRQKAFAAALTGAALATGAAAAAATGHPPVARAATTHVVSVRDDSYSRSSITIPRGDRVRWSWRNTEDPHSVRSGTRNPVSFQSKTEDGNYRYSHKFSKSGTYTIFCTVHPDIMRMKVKVTR